MTDQPLIAPAKIVLGKFRRGGGARAVAAVVQVSDVVLARPPEMLSHLRDDIGIACIGIGQLDDGRIGAVRFEIVFDVGGVRNATFKRVGAFWIAVYPDQQRINFAHHSRLSQLVCLRPRARLLSCFEGKVKALWMPAKFA